jgi:hemerythrin-like domain-containing protein
MMMGILTKAILEQHTIINKLLVEFEKVREDKTSMVNLFNSFKWDLDKHMFIEEQNFFPVANKNDKIEMTQLQNLMKDHSDLRKIISNFAEDVSDGIKPDVMIFKELLLKHEEREIKSFYPLLDARLSLEKKKEIMENLKDVRLG